MSFLSDLFNRIRNRNTPKLPENQEQQNLGQYRYNDIIKYMNDNGGLEEYFAEHEKILNDRDMYYPSEVHGINHTSRVTFNALVLAKIDNLDEHTKQVLLLAARYHDVGRIDDRETTAHGEFGVDKIEQLDLLKGITREDKKIIEFAVKEHSLPREQNAKDLKKIPFWKREKYNTILSYLKDADALDRARIANQNMQLDPNRLRHTTTKQLIDFGKENFFNFNNLIGEYEINKICRTDPVLSQAYSYAKESLTPEIIIDKQDLLRNLQVRGVLQNAKNEDLSCLDLMDEPVLVKGAQEVIYGDFETLRKQGFNITYQSFLRVVGQYEKGTLDLLRNKGKLSDIFSRRTFELYGEEKSFDDRLSLNQISDDELFEKINKNSTTKLLRSTFDKNYMLYKNMYEHNPNAFEMYAYNVPDISFSAVCGVAEVISDSSLKKFKDIGYNMSYNDIIKIASRFTPEEVTSILNSNDLTKLFRYDPARDEISEYTELFQKLQGQNPNVTEEDFKENYYLYKDILTSSYNIYETDELKGYSIKDIYPSFSKILDAEDKLRSTKNKNFSFNSKNLLDLIKFSKETKVLELANEEEKDNIITLLVENGEWKNNPRFIEYVTKKNKVYTFESKKDILDYNRFCMEKILLDPNLSLEEAKSNLINSLISINVPNSNYKSELEENIVDEIYYYGKYRKENKIKSDNSQEVMEMDEVLANFVSIMDASTISEFKDKLYDSYNSMSSFNFNKVLDIVQDKLQEFSKTDIVNSLKNTEQQINEMENQYVQYNGENIPVKSLVGQDFSLAVTTVMPNCSSISKRNFNMDHKLIKDNMLNRPLNPDNRCTSLIDQDMLAHAMSALQDNELMYAYVPNDKSSVSLTAKHDLSTVKRVNENGVCERVTERATQNRAFQDMTGSTTEEHNEAVLNGVYPRYIVCFDKISEVAIEKYKMLKEFYKQQGITPEIEILYIAAKEKYIPQIEQKLNKRFEDLQSRLETEETLTPEVMQQFFNKRERNITLETIQAINSSGYRNELWQPDKNKQKLDTLAGLLDKAASMCDRENMGDIMQQVDFMVKKADKTNPRYGYRVYDHSFIPEIDVEHFKKIKEGLDAMQDEQPEKRNFIQFDIDRSSQEQPEIA